MMTRKMDNNSGLVWSGLVWSGLVWSGLVWIILSACAHFVNTLIMPVYVGGREFPCLSGVFCIFGHMRRKGQVVNET